MHPTEGPIPSRAVVGLTTRRLTLILRQRLSKTSARHADQTFPASSRKSLPFQRLPSPLTLRPEGPQPSSSLSQRSPGFFPLADPFQAHHLVAPSRCSHLKVRRPLSVHPQGLSSAKVRHHQSLQAGSSGPIPSQAPIPHLWSSSDTAWDFFTLLAGTSAVHPPMAFLSGVFKLTPESHLWRLPFRLGSASPGLPGASPLLSFQGLVWSPTPKSGHPAQLASGQR